MGMARWTDDMKRRRMVAATGRPRSGVVVLLLAVVAPLAAVGLSGPAYGQPAPTPATAVTSHAASVSSCAPGDAQLDFVNDSGLASSDVYGAVTVGGGTVTPAAVVNNSVPLAGNFPVDPNDPSGDSFYVCLAPGVASGRLWLSIGSPISGLPSTQPTVSEPYRFGYVEFSYPGDVDYSNVNDFDFPVNLRTYAAPGGTAVQSQAVFSGNTCQIVNAVKSEVSQAPGADWGSIEQSGAGGQFIRIVSPSNGLANNGGWPSMVPYIEGLMGALPSNGPGSVGPITVEDYYVGGNADQGNVGWFDYHGTFDTATGALTLSGTLGATGAPGGSGAFPGQTMTVSLDGLAQGIYDQGHEYDVNGAPDLANDVYARIWNDLTGAFNFGYWGSSYGTGRDTKDFFASFAPPALPSGGQPAFPPARTASFAPATGGVAYNLYAAALSRFSPDYTIPEGENYGAGGTGINPLLPIPTGGEIQATLPADGWVGQSGSTTCVGGSSGGGGSGGGGGGAGGSSGYDEVAADGGVFSFGNAGYHGSMAGQPLNAPVVGLAQTPDGGGYWEVASDGGVFAFGDARFYGSLGGQHLNQPIVGVAATPDGGGYWEVASDGGVFAFGDAPFEGSLGGQPLDKPVVGIAATPGGDGYWEVASDGGVFAFGDARFYGSLGGQHLNRPVVGISATPGGDGYWEVASDGGAFSFGNAQFQGSIGGQPLNAPVVGMASTG
jgi:hypothetical protein